MSSCEIEWVSDNRVKISGVIDEHAVFDDMVKKFPAEVWLDFKDLSRINSCGVREWIKALMGCTTKIHYVNCPSVIVDQFSMIPEFLGEDAVVESFEAFYICDECSQEQSKILEVGKDIKLSAVGTPEGPEVICSNCGEIMDLDHDPMAYFSFLMEDDRDN